MPPSINVSSSIARPTHDVKLTYSGTSVGLILCDGRGDHDPTRIQRDPYPQSALKIYTGTQKYSDYEFPWTPISQTDWLGGRGLEDFDEDSTRYFDSRRAITWTPGKIISGPFSVYTTGYRGQSLIWPYKTSSNFNYYAQDISAIDATHEKPFASKFTTGAAFVPKYVFGVMRLTGSFDTTGPRITAKLWSHDAGNDQPNVMIASGYADVYSNEEDNNSVNPWLDFRVTLTLEVGTTTLAATTTYWVSFDAGWDSVNDVAWDVDILSHQQGTRGCTGVEGIGGAITWTVSTAATSSAYVRITDDEKPFRAHFFEFKDSLYMALQYEDGTAPKIYINGDQGLASAGAATSLTIDPTSGKKPTAIHYESGTWAADEWIGSVVKLTVGTGSTALDVSQVITDNDATSLTVADWNINPGANTQFAIVASDKWTEVDGHSITVPIMDALSHRENVYFALGSSTVMKRMRRYDNGSGTWDLSWSDETGYADLLTAVPAVAESSGTRTAITEIWAAKNQYPTGIKYATSLDGVGNGAVGTLTFLPASSWIQVGDSRV